MALDLGELVAHLRVDDDDYNQGLDRAEQRQGLFAGRISKAAKLAAAATAAGIGAAAVAGVRQFASLEKGMNEVFTLMPGISKKAMGNMTDDVKDFAVEFGVLPNDVVPALYQSLSAGVPPGNVFDFLETAQKAAKGGVTDLTTAVDGISSVVNAYGEDVVSAAEASDLMFTAVKLGKTNFEELSGSLYNVIPTASALGVEFGDVTAAIAAMTAQGTPTSVATTQMRQMLVELSKDGSKTSETFKEIAGKGFKEFIAGGGNVQDALQLMEKHAKKSDKGVNDLFGSVEAGAAALSLTGKGTDKFGDSLKGMQDSAGATEAAFDQMDQGLSASWDKIKSAGSVALIEVGDALSPVVAEFADWAEGKIPDVVAGIKDLGPVVDGLVGFLKDVVDVGGDVVGFFREHETMTKTLVGATAALVAVTQVHAAVLAVSAAGGLAAYVKNLPLIVSLTKTWTAVQWAMNAAMSANPIGLVIVVIAALVAALVIAYKKSETFRNVVKGAFEAVAAAGRWLWNNVLQPVFQFLVRGFATVMDWYAKMLRGLSKVPGFGWAEKAADSMSDAAAKARGLADDIKKIPDNKKAKITVSLPNLSKISSDLDWVARPRESRITVTQAYAAAGRQTQGGLQARHTGGPVTAGTPYLVGEYEPELFVPHTSGRILNGRQMAAAGVGGGDSGQRREQRPIYVYDKSGDPVRTARETVRYEELAGVG